MSIEKYGMFSWYGIKSSQVGRFRKIREAGFDAAMLWWGDEIAFDECNPKELVQQTRASGLIIENIHVPYKDANSLWSDDRNSRASIVRRHKEWLCNCSEYEIPIMVMHISTGGNVTVPSTHGLRCMAALVREAEKRNVIIALENTATTHLLRYLLTEIDSRNLCFCYDTSHAKLFEVEAFELMREFQDRISCFHISDNDGREDKHWIIGEGTIDWDGFVGAFPREYDGVLSIEVVPKNEETEERAFLSNAFRKLRKLGQKINMSR
jgi:sugar phosphate isomerase/epimerase